MAQPKITGEQLDTTSVEASLDVNALLPSQAGQNTKVLGTNGTTVSWVAQTGGGGGGETLNAFLLMGA